MARISVIMGIYNCASTLPEALESLLSQTYQDFKVIMCDDGSGDNTYEIAQSYVDRYPEKFILIKNEKNIKLAATLNHCLEYVDTELVARMDGDDISLPERFEKEVEFLDNHPEYAFVSTPMIYFDEDGDFMTGKANGEPTRESFRYGSPFCHAPCMVRAEAYNAVGGYTDTERTLRMEDYYLWYKMYKAGFKGFNILTPLYKMRDDRNAKRRRISMKNRINGLKTDIEVLKGLGLKNPRTYPIFHFIYGSISQFFPYKLMKRLRTIYHTSILSKL